MSNTPVLEPPAQRLSSGSVQTLPSRPLQPSSDPSASKRVCFYKSGDSKFSGHRMVINARTFKTFDALLDALSKKVPLPFGVRTITTPRGSHLVKNLDDLQDGGCYVCSDQKRVKPLNLDEVNRRQVPWNTTRPLSAGRRRRHRGLQFSRRNDVDNRPPRVTEKVAVRTPKRLVVIKNKDPTFKRTIVLQRRIAPTFDALLDYLSQILQFPVLKLYSTDGRRVEGLAALILCSGVIVAAGNEPFRLGNYSFQRTGQMAQVMYMETVEPSMLQPRAQNDKSFSSGRGSRNFSLSSERYIVNQINKSRNGSMGSHVHQHNGSFETEVHPRHTSVESCETGRVETEHHTCIVPQDDDIEKSFRVNQDGSMTVEMKVRLTIKEEEMLHWTTTLSRSSLREVTACASISESGNSSPNSNNAIAKDSSSVSEDENKEQNRSPGDRKGVGFNDERVCESFTSTALGKGKKSFKRTSTPGPRYVKKKASIESVKMVTESGVHENTLGHYSYMERTAIGESAEGYCVIRHNSSSNRPIPKPRKTASAETSKKDSHSSIRSSGVADVLQIQNNGMEVTETVMHIYESQGCYDNYFANEEYSTDGAPLPDTKPSTASELHSSSNDIDFSWQPPTADSLQRQKEEMLSLSSEPISSMHKLMNDLSSVTETEAHTATNSQTEETVKKDKTPKSEKDKKMVKPARNQKSSTSSSDQKQKKNTSPSKNSKHSSTDKHSSNASVGKKSQSSSESAKNGQRSKGAEMKPEKPQSKKSIIDEKTPRKDSALIVNTENVKRTPPKRQSMNKAAARDNSHNVDTPSGRTQMKKNMSDILKSKKSLLPVKKTLSKPKSMTENRVPSPKQTLALNESVSMPSLNPTPSEIYQYVENWLEKVSPDQVPSTEDTIPDELEPQTKVVFQIGGDSEIDENNESQTDLEKPCSQPTDAVKKSPSCLSVPLFHEGPAESLLHSEQKSKGLCVSMPSVRIDPVPQENRLRAHKSAEDISPADNESSSSNILSPRGKIKPVLRQLCSSIQCIRRVSDTNITSSLEKSNSLPDFSTQVALVFGSSCKAFLSFLSVMTLRDSLTGSAPGDVHQSRSTSEAMLMMESLQKISAIEDEDEQKASLTDLQSRASSRFRERWKDFQILRERLESEPLSPRVSETEFALDVVSESGDVFEDQHLGINELMDELNMPEDLRAEISSTIQHARTFYPVEESTLVETERNQSDSDEEVEQFVEECNNERKQSPELDSTCIADGITDKNQDSDDRETDDLNKMQSMYFEQAKTMCESEQAEVDVNDSEVSQTETDEPLNHSEPETEDKEDQAVEDGGEKEDPKDTNNFEREELVNVGNESEEETMKKEAEWESGEESAEKVEEGTEEETTVGGEEVQWENVEGEETEVEDTEEGIVDLEDQETRHSDSAEETDEREIAEETEEEEREGGKEETQVTEEETDEVVEETDEEQEVGSIKQQEEEESGVEGEDAQVAENEAEVEEVIEEADEGEEAESSEEEEEKEEEAEARTENEAEEEVEEVIEETEEEEQNRIDEVGVKEEEVEVVSEGDVEEGEVAAEETDEEKEVVNITEKEDKEEGEEEMDVITEGRNAEEEETEVVSEENNDKEEEERGQEEEEDDAEGDSKAEDENMEEERAGMITEEEGEEGETGSGSEEERKCDEFQESGNVLENPKDSLEEESAGEKEEMETEVNMKTGQKLEEDEDNGLNEGLQVVEKQESKDEEEEVAVKEDVDSFIDAEDHQNVLDTMSYLQQQYSSCEEANVGQNCESPSKCSSDVQCEDDKGNGTDSVNELETDEWGERLSSQPHPVEISQELLDFVNSALQSSSLTFTYDSRGNIRIEPDNACVVQSKQIVIPKSSKDSLYGLNCLPSPSTSDLSDYRPETSESGGYKTQESVDIVTDSGEEASEKPFPVYRPKTEIPDRRTNVIRPKSKLSVASKSEVLESSRLKSAETSYDSGSKASKEDLSYFSAASSLKADAEAAPEAAQCISEKNSTDGVLIDQGRWLLKENHLIRKSPPISLGMYGNLDSTSIDTGQENASEESPSHSKTQHSPLAAISSSELEEMAKPLTPKCTYYNMPHGSDSDPFLDEISVKSGKKDSSSFRGRGSRVSPTIDTSKTWPNKNGSLSSFASVEFKMPDRKVHPEGESSSVTQTRRTSSGASSELQAQDSLDTLHVRCSQFCPIL
ncbi:oxygen-regulated protein 1 [Anabas testudineus]|uniref:Doublecortin domain-containing protein n=1 Tax=Anabas testudineus TaxID=64144 RepID=A0AAQ6IAH7_ANATE|nr:oxygen-regulated protein 1 [Anabas testudineus]XP_026229705.1 oxygen-regulated protein 1 [Anabas testudineus]